MRILFIGALWSGSTGLHRMNALRDMHYEVFPLDTTHKGFVASVEGAMRRFSFLFDLTKLNNQIVSLVAQQKVDLVWVDKTLKIAPKTLLSIKSKNPACKLLFYSPDDMMLPGNQSVAYHACVPLYDLHVTTKSYNVVELQAMGACDVFFVDNAYDCYTHRPVTLTPQEQKIWQAEVGFVGGFEQDRYEAMVRLAEAGLPVTIRGPGWEPYLGKHRNLRIAPGWVYSDDYTRSICATKVNLGFLRKIARDLQTTRSIEIPACGGFMLAERTAEHARLFIEGKEAEFFADVDELLAKTRYYLAHDAAREQIALAGRARCVQGGYSNHDRLRRVLEYLATTSLPGRS